MVNVIILFRISRHKNGLSAMLINRFLKMLLCLKFRIYLGQFLGEFTGLHLAVSPLGIVT